MWTVSVVGYSHPENSLWEAEVNRKFKENHL
jgi:hypothetical protein